MPHDHPRERERVATHLADHVLAFCQSVGVGNVFHGPQLASYCMVRVTCSPSSPDRILRLLADEGRVAYRVLSRRRSEYRLEGVWPGGRPVEASEQLALAEGW